MYKTTAVLTQCYAGLQMTRLPTHSGRRQRPIISYVDVVYHNIKKGLLLIKDLPLKRSTGDTAIYIVT